MQRLAHPTESQDTSVRHGWREIHTINATGHKPEIRNKKRLAVAQVYRRYPAAYVIKPSSGETINKKEHTWVKQDNIPATCEKRRDGSRKMQRMWRNKRNTDQRSTGTRF